MDMNVYSSTVENKFKQEEPGLKYLFQNGLWKDLYQRAEQCFTSASNVDADSACTFACFILASLLKLGKLDLARKWLNSWKKQYGWEDVPSENLSSMGPIRTQYCLLAVEVAFRQSLETNVNHRLQPYFQLRKLIEENSQLELEPHNVWLLFLDMLDCCIVGHLLEANRLEAALEVAKNYLERNVHDVSRHLAFFRLLVYVGDMERASLFWKSLEPRVKEDSERHLHRGLLYVAQRRVEDAIDEWEAAALFEHRHEATLTNNIVVGFLLQGRVFEAMERMEHMFRKSPVLTLEDDLIKHICICYDMLFANAQERKSSIQHDFAYHAPESSHFQNTPTATEQ